MAGPDDIKTAPRGQTDGDGGIDVESSGGTDHSLVALIRQVLGPTRDDPEVAEPSIRRFGKFQVLREIGLGSFGKVVLVLDPDLGRERALKMPHLETLESPDALSRFLGEARLAARIDHPNVVRVHEAGTIDGLPYLLMEYCASGSLREWLARRPGQDPLPCGWVAELVAEIAEGAHQAHLAGLLHRDIKPGNILLERRTGEADLDLPRFRPKIADFGLAKVFEEDGMARALTASGAALGTWAYMSPEQARGDKEIRATTDVYAIGVILRELLTGESLYVHRTPAEICARLLDLEPILSPRSIRAEIPRDLETICRKCLEKSPTDRYQSAGELTSDLRRYLEGLPILARPSPIWSRVYFRLRRHPVHSALIASALVLTSIVTVGLNRLREDRAQRLIHTLFEVPIEVVPRVVDQLEDYRAESRGSLREILDREPVGSARATRAALVLLRSDEGLTKNLIDRLMVCGAREHSVIRDSLRDARPAEARAEARRIWEVLADRSANSATRLRAATVLSGFDAESADWSQHGPAVAANLIEAGGQGPEVVEWARILAPIGRYCESELRRIMADRSSSVASLAASWALAELLATRPLDLATLLLEADPRQLKPMAARLTGDRHVLTLLQQSLKLPTLLVGHPGREQLAIRRANAAAALARLGVEEIDWRGFERSDDPAPRTYLIERLAATGVPPRVLLGWISRLSSDTMTQTIVLALGEYSDVEFDAGDRDAASRSLLYLYRAAPDAGVHSAVAWLLRRWGKEAELNGLDLASRSRDQPSERRWMTDGEGHTLSIIPGPTEFKALLSVDPENWNALMQNQVVSIRRSFAIGVHEVDIRQFQRYLAEARVSTRRLDRYPKGLRFSDAIGSDDRCPINRVSYYAAAQYCLWLSEKAGISPDQWCYEKLDESPLGPIRPYPDFLDRTGYRLPIYEEWTFALMARTATAHYFGPGTQGVSLFEWLGEDLSDQTRPVGTKRPNRLGLHDMLGNLSEWCTGPQPWEPNRKPLLIGSNMRAKAASALQFKVGGIDPDYPAESTGFRVARTLLP